MSKNILVLGLCYHYSRAASELDCKTYGSFFLEHRELACHISKPIYKAMQISDEIYFIMNEISLSEIYHIEAIDGNMTNWELSVVMKEFVEKTTFYYRQVDGIYQRITEHIIPKIIDRFRFLELL